MRTGWYQRYREEYSRQKRNGATHEEANRAAIEMLKKEV